jgi:hypothetical protein
MIQTSSNWFITLDWVQVCVIGPSLCNWWLHSFFCTKKGLNGLWIMLGGTTFTGPGAGKFFEVICSLDQYCSTILMVFYQSPSFESLNKIEAG